MDVTYTLWDNAQPGTLLNILLMNQSMIPYKNATKNPNPTKYMYDNGAGPPTPFMMDSNGCPMMNIKVSTPLDTYLITVTKKFKILDNTCNTMYFSLADSSDIYTYIVCDEVIIECKNNIKP